MRLISLSANKESFRTINFKEGGISIIAARQKTINKKKTYNSVGKSLSIALIHFCLGSNYISDFGKKLKDWEFYLEFEIGGKSYLSKRLTSLEFKNRIFLNDEELALKDFNKKMGSLVFNLDETMPYVSFRGLISRFIRPRKSSYSSYDSHIVKEKPIIKQMNNSYLLGLELDYVREKFELREKQKSILAIKKNWETDPVIKNTMNSSDSDYRNIEINRVELEVKKKKLENNIKNFKLARDYEEVRKRADVLTRKLRDLSNEKALYEISVENIKKSLRMKPDVSSNTIVNFYELAKVQLNDLVKKRLSEVEEFNEKILSNRIKKLSEEKLEFEKKIRKLKERIKKIAIERDEKLKYISSHGVLEEFVVMNNQLSEVKVSLSKINDYKKVLKDYAEKLNELSLAMTMENIRANEYLDDIQVFIDKIIYKFKSLSNEFYNDKPAGLTIAVNQGNNFNRFDIEASITSDSGDGVGDVKTFCFDWTLLKVKQNHNVKFIVHDSRITDGLDSRQKATMLEVAYRETELNKFQYIISLNQNAINDIEREMSEEQFKENITNNIVLELDDLSDENKLLGIQVDLDY